MTRQHPEIEEDIGNSRGRVTGGNRRSEEKRQKRKKDTKRTQIPINYRLTHNGTH